MMKLLDSKDFVLITIKKEMDKNSVTSRRYLKKSQNATILKKIVHTIFFGQKCHRQV